MPADLSVTFGSISGSTFAFYFFLVISVFIGVAAYAILTKVFAEKLTRGSVVTRWPVLLVSSILSVLIFASVYFSMIYGFYELRIHQNKVFLTYVLPRHTVELAKSELSEAMRSPTYRGRWVLTIYTTNGQPYQSAASSYRSVLVGYEGVQTLLGK